MHYSVGVLFRRYATAKYHNGPILRVKTNSYVNQSQSTHVISIQHIFLSGHTIIMLQTCTNLRQLSLNPGNLSKISRSPHKCRNLHCKRNKSSLDNTAIEIHLLLTIEMHLLILEIGAGLNYDTSELHTF